MPVGPVHSVDGAGVCPAHDHRCRPVGGRLTPMPCDADGGVQ